MTDSVRYIDMTLPADKDMMIVARLATTGALSRSGMTLDMLDDVKMAVEEACNCLSRQLVSPARIAIRFGLCDNSFTFSVKPDCGLSECAFNDEAEFEIAKCILESLVDKAEIVTDGDILKSITLTVALPR